MHQLQQTCCVNLFDSACLSISLSLRFFHSISLSLSVWRKRTNCKKFLVVNLIALIIDSETGNNRSKWRIKRNHLWNISPISLFHEFNFFFIDGIDLKQNVYECIYSTTNWLYWQMNNIWCVLWWKMYIFFYVLRARHSHIRRDLWLCYL